MPADPVQRTSRRCMHLLCTRSASSERRQRRHGIIRQDGRGRLPFKSTLTVRLPEFLAAFLPCLRRVAIWKPQGSPGISAQIYHAFSVRCKDTVKRIAANIETMLARTRGQYILSYSHTMRSQPLKILDTRPACAEMSFAIMVRVADIFHVFCCKHVQQQLIL